MSNESIESDSTFMANVDFLSVVSHSEQSSEETDFFSSADHRSSTLNSLSQSKENVHVELKGNRTEVFSIHSSTTSITTDTNHSSRKRDKMHSLYRKTFHNHTPTTNTTEWNETVARALVKMHENLEQISYDVNKVVEPHLDRSVDVLQMPRLSHYEHQRAKFHMMKMSQMFSPPNFVPGRLKEQQYPYTDLIQTKNIHLTQIMKGKCSYNQFSQHKPYKHRNPSYKIQRGLLKIQRDTGKLKKLLYGRTTKQIKELPILDMENYRKRLEETLIEVRQQIAEYDRMHATDDTGQPTISQIITKLVQANSTESTRCMTDYCAKLRPIEYIEKRPPSELISAPFVPRRKRNILMNNKQNQNDDNCMIDKRFNPSTFVDLSEEAEQFFDFSSSAWIESLIEEMTRNNQNTKENPMDNCQSIEPGKLKMKTLDICNQSPESLEENKNSSAFLQNQELLHISHDDHNSVVF